MERLPKNALFVILVVFFVSIYVLIKGSVYPLEGIIGYSLPFILVCLIIDFVMNKEFREWVQKSFLWLVKKAGFKVKE